VPSRVTASKIDPMLSVTVRLTAKVREIDSVTADRLSASERVKEAAPRETVSVIEPSVWGTDRMNAPIRVTASEIALTESATVLL